MAPFAGIGGFVVRLFGFGRFEFNPQLCEVCIGSIGKHRGGAEVDVSLLFVDVRGSTSLGERVTPSQFRGLLDRFYRTVAMAVDRHDGVIDNMVGDGVMAMWIPAFTSGQHARSAIDAGIEVLERIDKHAEDVRLPVGGGVHTGVAYVGVVGDEQSLDFTTLGDAPNTASRVGSAANEGELLVTRAAAIAAGLSVDLLETRVLELKGKAEPVEILVVRQPVAA
jgi:adenylate cyclase